MYEPYVGIARRENNNKRNYLVVNRLQGKHVPVSPQKAFDMFGQLAEVLKDEYKNEKVLVIGFAETATAIGTAVGIALDSYYMQTTREDIVGVEYLCFSESHSHATEQKLVKEDVDKVMDKINRIIFVEDEITTGNTILNIINIIQKTYAQKVEFSVASLLNGMNEESKAIYDESGIDVHYILKTYHDEFIEIADTFKGDGIYNVPEPVIADEVVTEILPLGYSNPRRLTIGGAYLRDCQYLWEQVKKAIEIKDEKNILVVGTEELMYPALYIARQLETMDKEVRCHATTRSPITVSSEEDYPLHTRFQLKSLYDGERTTYIYELTKYDQVIIITDSTGKEKKGLNSLVGALCMCGNTKIHLIRWC